MKVRVLEAFPYSHDGMHVKHYVPGDELVIDPNSGPVIKGFVESIEAPVLLSDVVEVLEESGVEVIPDTPVVSGRRRR